jgi:hypothetical protein
MDGPIDNPMDDVIAAGRRFDVEDPLPTPLVFMPDETDVNWGTVPLPPPRPLYKRDPDDIPDDEAGVTSDWNFTLPT